MNTKSLHTILVLFLLPLFSVAQDIHFSQFWMTTQQLNPAFDGIDHKFMGTMNYKDQWRSANARFRTFDVAYDMNFQDKKNKKGFLAAGINFFGDRAGSANMSTSHVNLSLAYHIHLNKQNTFGAGLSGGFAQRSINYATLEWGSQFDGTDFNSSLPTGESVAGKNFSFFDAGAGLLWTYSRDAHTVMSNDQLKFNFGISAFHPHQPSYSFIGSDERLFPKLVLTGNSLIGIKNTNLSLQPGFIYFMQGATKEFLVGTMFRYNLQRESKITGFVKASNLSLGCYYRSKDALILSLLMEKGPYAFGFSYDVNISDLSSATTGRGGMEISLRYSGIAITNSNGN
jgi:type IX secretion system PorP/SprF family membrane protein